LTLWGISHFSLIEEVKIHRFIFGKGSAELELLAGAAKGLPEAAQVVAASIAGGRPAFGLTSSRNCHRSCDLWASFIISKKSSELA
jgi:hypothetical protein